MFLIHERLRVVKDRSGMQLVTELNFENYYNHKKHTNNYFYNCEETD